MAFNRDKAFKEYIKRATDTYQPCKDIFVRVVETINTDKDYCRTQVKNDADVDKLYDEWYGKHQQDYGAAVFHALLATIGMFEDRRGEFETINGVEVMPIADLIDTLKIELICKLSGNDDLM